MTDGKIAKIKEMSREEVDDFAIRTAMENELLRKAIYGAKSERHVPPPPPEQMRLELGEVAAAEEPPQTELVSYERKKPARRKPHPGRHALPEHLPRKVVRIEPDEDTTGMKLIGEEVTEALDYTPAKFVVIRYVRPKYARPEGEGVVCAPMPSRPLDKAIAEASLLALILCDKYLDHLPLYRQIQRFKRLGITIADSTINGWIGKVCQLLEPLYQAHRKMVLTRDYLQVDETTFKVLDRDKRGKAHLGYQWVYHSPVERLVLFEYHPRRSKAPPARSLQNYGGYLQTDGYAAYEQFHNKTGIVMLGCMAHARRKFFEAGEDHPHVKHALSVFRKLYAIERKVREYQLSHQQRQAIRMKEAKPLWEKFQKWMIQEFVQHVPSHPVRKAIEYTLPRWKQLGGYILNGKLEIDNNLIENQIRPVALGRKNYLFAGSHSAAQRASMIYSLLSTAKLHQIEPFEWLKSVIKAIPDHPINRIEGLLPQNWDK